MEPHISKSIQYTVNRGNKTINKQMIAQRPIIAFKIEITYHVLRYHNSGYDCDWGHLAAAADYPINEKKSVVHHTSVMLINSTISFSNMPFSQSNRE